MTAPADMILNFPVSPDTRPKTFTGLYARGWSPVLTGVGPKKIQNAGPAGQYARFPTATSARASGSNSRKQLNDNILGEYKKLSEIWMRLIDLRSYDTDNRYKDT